MQNESKLGIVDDNHQRKRYSNAGLENSPPNKMGKQNRSNNYVRKRSPENILKDIKELKQKRKENCEDHGSENHVTWHTETAFCPAADAAIPQRALDEFVRFLSHEDQHAEKLQFWRRQYDESMSEDTVQIIDDQETLALCPVCQRELPKSQIETHADECAAKMFQN